jgi:hypothetical protein
LPTILKDFDTVFATAFIPHFAGAGKWKSFEINNWLMARKSRQFF